MDKELTQEQRDEIATLSNSELSDVVYLEWLENYNDFSDFDEAYLGEFSSDEDFAQSTADGMGVLPKEYSWPLSYIDWEAAARDLMMDHFEVEGHYFRQM